MYNILKRILAIAGIIFLLGIYIVTFILAISGKQDMQGWFAACVVATVIVPGMMWAIQYIYKRLNADMEDAMKKDDNGDEK